MKINRLLVLLPCYSLENLEIERNTAESEQILSAWTALYHPSLVHAAHSMPGWLSANMTSQEVSDSLVILPTCCESLLPEEWLANAESAGLVVLRNPADREALAAAALKSLNDPTQFREGDAPAEPCEMLESYTSPTTRQEPHPPVDPELVADFFALGYCHLMVELLTRKLRYMSNLDESAFRTSLIAAADAAVQGDGESARTHLQSAFDRLHDAREYFYPTEPRLLDLTLLASTTLGELLRKELQNSSPHNILLSGDVLEEMATREPQSLAALKETLSQKTASLIGGEFAELPLPLLPPEAIAENLENGIAVYEKHLGCRPKIFGRRRFGLTLALPQILEKFGFSAALHFTLDDGQFPTGNQSRAQWEGFDGGTIEALTRIPLDANKADSFLSLPRRLGNCMELDHSPAQVFAHWPGVVSPWYDDLRRIASYSHVLGHFCTIDEFFDRTQLAGQRVQYQADKYRSPYLTQDAAPGNQDAISRWVRFYQRRGITDGIQSLQTLSALLSKKSFNDQLDFQMQESLDAATVAFAESLRGEPTPSEKDSATEKGYLLVNPLSFSHRQGVMLPDLAETPALSDAILATSDKAAVVDLPSMGFVWIGSGGKEQAGVVEVPVEPKEPPLAGEHSLRNEYFEIKFDPITGAIRAVLDYKSRHPRLAQQIGLRMPQGESDPADDKHYSIMAADELRIASTNSVLGEMLCRGRLMDCDGQKVAGFQQLTRVWRGSRVIEIEIEIDPQRMPDARPWNSYYACRFAWHIEDCSFSRGVNLANQLTEAVQLESPLFIDILSGKLRTTILGGGLPYHRRIGPRKLDTLLIVQGETARKFRIGVGIDVPNPTTAALAFIAPPIKLFGSYKPPASSGWLFHLDHRNVIATSWLPLSLGESQGSQNGFRVRLLETEGRSALLKLRCMRNVTAARKLENGNMPAAELKVEGDAVHIPMSPHQWLEVEVLFETPQ
jgi:alpha-mannosidase